MVAHMSNANFPTDDEGRVYHIFVKPGQVANRIVTAGDPARVRRFAAFLDREPKPFECLSARGYLTVTGRYEGVPVSLIAIGMGYPNMDFLVRETRAVVEGDMAIVRFGSCGSLDASLAVGSIGVVANAMTITTQYDHWHVAEGAIKPAPYVFSLPIPSDPVLHECLLDSLKSVGSSACEIRDVKLHASADCFYSSQGRIDPSFEDNNSHLIAELHQSFPDLTSLEMETAHLFHLARISRMKGNISAAAAHMIFASRTMEAGGVSFIDPAVVSRLEPLVGRACLDAVIAFDIPSERLHPEEGSVWAM